MARYIDADALKKMFVDGVRVHKGMCSVMNVIHNINNAPTADVEEVKHGYNKSRMNPVDEFICSECGAMFADVSLVKEDEENGDINYYEFEFKYCPNCGAKMSAIPTGPERVKGEIHNG